MPDGALGLPRGRSAKGGVHARLTLRVEGLDPRQRRLMVQSVRKARGTSWAAPARLHDAWLKAAGAPDPELALVLDLPADEVPGLSASLRKGAGAALASEIGAACAAAAAPSATLPFLPTGRRTLLMGVLNVTPDSFSDGGQFTGLEAAVRQAVRLAEEGADIVDVGGESTRPGAVPVGLHEELRRVLPVLEAIGLAFEKLPRRRPLLSIDTTKAEVARRAALLGVTIVNDVSGLTRDPAMPAVVAEHRSLVVLQHTRGRPRTMQRAIRYRAVVPEVAAFLRASLAQAVRAGVPREHVILDPGLGFGKRRAHNLALLRHLGVLRSLGRPILVGASRKSFLRADRDEAPEARREAGLAAMALAVAQGAAIIRAHDVHEARRVARLCDAVLRGATDNP
ncbi:MAG TPA: dihydropteroate synthase [Candidatus Polarisedimenticolia bacterium]|nr:dihydropteroate synthase [Candidatus Polarisedimenticolia bacterium]